MSRFKIGDIVKLKSGGEPMTVVDFGLPKGTARLDVIDDTNPVICTWFEQGVMKKDSFPNQSLEKMN